MVVVPHVVRIITTDFPLVFPLLVVMDTRMRNGAIPAVKARCASPRADRIVI